MTGPEHYRTAEGMLIQAREAEAGTDVERYYLAAAQVHAALALAAATALAIREDVPLSDYEAWIDAASAYKPPVKLTGGAS